MKHYDSQSGYDLYAPNYRKDHGHLDSFDWLTAQPLLASLIEDHLVKTQEVSVLDLGCGDGRVLKRLARLSEQRGWTDRLNLHGWDISEGMLRQARKALPASVKLQRRDLRETAPDSGFYQVIYSFFVLVHIDEPAEFLENARQIMQPGGQFLFNNIPQKQALVLESAGQKFQIDYVHHEHSAIVDAIEQSGLRLVRDIATEWSQLYLVENPTK